MSSGARVEGGRASIGAPGDGSDCFSSSFLGAFSEALRRVCFQYRLIGQGLLGRFTV